ncbi:hypothetical protein SAMN02745116_01763 [Pilibacter termitis]|uniref:Replication-associated protein ORF2/G2P domain-containing protein n=1 Tax=Pilibacter termitis TaxID=263852 RepID=A0A1T4PDI1_9ENTE|nr:hypothetical protein [Pilibacter termitis]SJZ89421.1 hypothetical protein SAMN02745116_01763 [Pilibacter termitis]
MQFMKEVRYSAGEEYQEVSILPKTEKIELLNKPHGRKRKKDASRPEQRNLNYQNASKWFRLTAIANFKEGSYSIVLTFNDLSLPKSQEEAEKEFKNYMRRLNARRKKRGLANAKYLATLEGRNGRYHFNVLLDSSNTYDEIEECWQSGRGKKLLPKGFVHIKKIKKVFKGGKWLNGVEVVAQYMTKEFKEENRQGKRKWFASRNNLKKPVIHKPNKYKYTRSKIIKAVENDSLKEFLQEKYQGWEFVPFTIYERETKKSAVVEIDVREDLFLGVRIYFRLRKIDKEQKS